MPWLAFPHGDERIKALNTKYAVSGIPWLVIIDAKSGALVANEADTDVTASSGGSCAATYAAWLAKSIASTAAA